MSVPAWKPRYTAAYTWQGLVWIPEVAIDTLPVGACVVPLRGHAHTYGVRVGEEYIGYCWRELNPTKDLFTWLY